jgi:hypothetical protein
MQQRMPSSLVWRTALVYVGVFAVDRLLTWAFNAQSLAGMVAMHLAAAGVAVGGFYLIGPGKPGKVPELHVSKLALLVMGMAGLAIVVTITVVSREWWLAVEMLVLFAVLLAVVMFLQLRKAEQPRAE